MVPAAGLRRCVREMNRALDEAVTIVISVESYFEDRKVKWDPVNEVIVSALKL